MALTVIDNEPLDEETTFRVPANARWYVPLSEVEDVEEAWEEGYLDPTTTLVLGSGSNILFVEDWPGTVAHVLIPGLETEMVDDQIVQLRVGGGVNWHYLVQHVVRKGWWGLENLALIPGTVGAAPMQNIGAYGAELSQTLLSVEALDRETGELVTIMNEDCQFGYRTSRFKTTDRNRYLILYVNFQLTTEPAPQITYGELRDYFEGVPEEELTPKEIAKAVIRIRTSKLPDPDRLGNAGSFFKNPIVPAEKAKEIQQAYEDLPMYPQVDGSIKLPAGWLIEQAGWKGKKVGKVGCYDKQALVLVNHGGATGAQVWKHAQKVHQSVLKKFGINLEPEVLVLGGDPLPEPQPARG